MDNEFLEPPKDWRNPDWKNCSQVHDWKNYIDERLRARWSMLSSDQKQLLAYQADQEAGREEWD